MRGTPSSTTERYSDREGAYPGYTSDGKWLIDSIRLRTWLQRDDGREYAVWGINSSDGAADTIYVYTPELGLPVSVSADSIVFTIRNGTVERKESGLSQVVAQPGSIVAVFGPYAYENGARWGNQLEVGMKVSLLSKLTPSRPEKEADWDKVTFCVTVGPFLLRDGVDVSYSAEQRFPIRKQPRFCAAYIYRDHRG